MPSATIVHAAVFAVGALVGGGVATAVSARSRRDMLPPVPTQGAPAPPVIHVKPGQGTQMQTAPGQVVKVDTSVLKYGNPGTSDALLTSVSVRRTVILTSDVQDPLRIY